MSNHHYVSKVINFTHYKLHIRTRTLVRFFYHKSHFLRISNILLMLKRAGKSCQLRVLPINLSVNSKHIASKIFGHKAIAANFGRDLSCKPEN